MPFSSELSNWLSTHSSFVNAAFAEDMQGGRSLGPASGTLWDAYPFLHGCAYSGLFAGISLSGDVGDETDIYLLEYSSAQGFAPTQDTPFSGERWQEFSSDHWLNISPVVASVNPNPSVNPVDLKFVIGKKTYDTRAWRYSGIRISNKYFQHSWVGEGCCLVAVTFLDRPEHTSPFLRPCFVTGRSARLDPHCLYSSLPSSRLFSGRVLLVPGSQIDFSIQNASITVTRADPEEKTQMVRKISGMESNVVGNFSCVSGGCHRFTQRYEEFDPLENAVRLQEGEIAIQNACRPCCRCEEYISAYERLRGLSAAHSKLIAEFSALYAQSVHLRDRIEVYLRKKARLIRAYFGEWGEDSDGFYCIVMVVIAATVSLRPGTTATIGFTRGTSLLTVRSVTAKVKLAALSFTVSVCEQGRGVQMRDIRTDYVGEKTARLRVRFREHFDISTFDPSMITIVCDGAV